MDNPDPPTVEEELEFQRAVAERMEAEKDDPRNSLYFRVAGTDRIVKTDEELQEYQKAGIRLEYVSYNQAAECLARVTALNNDLKKRRKKNKQAKAARRRNRGR